MSKVITFSRVFPVYHPKAGQSTYFVEQIYNSIYRDKSGDWSEAPGTTSNYVVELEPTILGRKHHTIRNGSRWKVGDKFSPRVWSGKPYQTKQIVIADDLEIKKIYDFEIKIVEVDGGFASKGFLNDKRVSPDYLMEIAENDGLLLEDFLAWFQFPKSFKGQVICWSDAVSYGCR